MARTWTRLLLASVVALATLASVAPASADDTFPEVIALPDGWQPEGIARGWGTTMLSGSRASGDVVAVDVVTGETGLFVDAPGGRSALGLELDRVGRLWVAGGAAGAAYVYDADGAPLAEFQLTTNPAFINDVVVTKDVAWFTDSRDDVLYKIPIDSDGSLGPAEAVALTGDFQLTPGFNLNGIDASAGGRWLVVVQTSTGRLFRVDPDTGETVVIDLGASLPNGDGILLDGRTLYVVQNQLNEVAVVRLDSGLTSGEIEDEITSPNFDVPTTVAALGSRLYLVNARFTTPPTPTTPYSMVWVRGS